jgi:hypothetical protein
MEDPLVEILIDLAGIGRILCLSEPQAAPFASPDGIRNDEPREVARHNFSEWLSSVRVTQAEPASSIAGRSSSRLYWGD